MKRRDLTLLWQAVIANRKILHDEYLTVVKIDPEGP